MKKSLIALLLGAVLLLSVLPFPAAAAEPAYTLLLGTDRYTAAGDGVFTPALPEGVSFMKRDGIPVLHLNGYRGTTVEFSAADASEKRFDIDISGKVTLAGGPFSLCGPEGLYGAVGFNQAEGQIFFTGTGKLLIGMTGEYKKQAVAVYARQAVNSFVPVTVEMLNEKTSAGGVAQYSCAGTVGIFSDFTYHYSCDATLKNAKFAPGEIRIGGSGIVDIALYTQAQSGEGLSLFSKTYGSGNLVTFSAFRGAAYFHTDAGALSDGVFDAESLPPADYYLYNTSEYYYENEGQLKYADSAAVIFKAAAASVSMGLKPIDASAYDALNGQLDEVVEESPLFTACLSEQFYASVKWYAKEEGGVYSPCSEISVQTPSRLALAVVPKCGYYFDYDSVDMETCPVKYAVGVSQPVESASGRHLLQFSFQGIEYSGPVVGILGEQQMLNGSAVQMAPKLTHVPDTAVFRWYMYENGENTPLSDTDFGGEVYAGTSTPVLTIYNNALEKTHPNAQFWLRVDVFGYNTAVSTSGWIDYFSDKTQVTAAEKKINALVLSGLPLPTEADPSPAYDQAEELFYDGKIKVKSVRCFRDVYGDGDFTITLELQAQDTYCFNQEAYLEWLEYEAAGGEKNVAATRVSSAVYENDSVSFTVNYAIPAPEEQHAHWTVQPISLEVAAPTAGETPQTVTAAMRKNALRQAGAQYALLDMQWSAEGKALSADAVFEPGKDYTVTMLLSAAAGFAFTEQTQVKVNGNPAQTQLAKAKYDPLSGSIAAPMLTVSYTFPAEPIAAVCETVAAPVAGMRPDVSGIGASSPFYTVEAVSWQPEVDPFIENGVYTVLLVLRAVPGLWFDEQVTAAVNGAAAKVELISADCARVTYTFPAARSMRDAAGETQMRIVRGDVDESFIVTAADARLALRASVGLETYAAGSVPALAADVNRDGKITAADARRILRAAVGLETLPL